MYRRTPVTVLAGFLGSGKTEIRARAGGGGLRQDGTRLSGHARLDTMLTVVDVAGSCVS